MLNPLHRCCLSILAVGLSVGCGSEKVRDTQSSPLPRVNVDAGSLGPVADDCGAHLTAYPGDCQAPPAIDPSVGVVAHYGPRDYDDPKEIADYVIAPGEEVVDCGYSTLSNESDVYYDRYDVFSRPATHHVILTALTDATVADGLHDDCSQRDHGGALLAVVQGGLRGNVYHYPPSADVPPENVGIGTKLNAHASIAYELHAVNATEQPLLRENWTVFYTMPADQVTQTSGQMAFNGGLSMNIAPHTRQTIQNSCTVSSALGKVRVVDLFGHMHSHGKRFSAWAAQKDSTGQETRTLIYESYDWSELDLIQFNSVKTNTPIQYAGGVPGGISGDLFLSAGDRIDYECDMFNTEDFSLRFAAKVLTGEMCNMFGSFTPGSVWSCLGN